MFERLFAWIRAGIARATAMGTVEGTARGIAIVTGCPVDQERLDALLAEAAGSEQPRAIEAPIEAPKHQAAPTTRSTTNGRPRRRAKATAKR